MMEPNNKLGMNRTGTDMSPKQSKAMLANVGLAQYGPPDPSAIAAIRTSYLKPSPSLGSTPLPGTIKGTLKSGMDKLKGHNPEVMINKLGERLAFERTGVRLYDALIMRCEAGYGGDGGSPAIGLDRLRQFREEELEHLLLVKEVMESIGADPTAQTPDADMAALASLGVVKVLSEPKTSIGQCLEAMLMAEMTDNAGWELLTELCQEMGMDETVDSFQHALDQEAEHMNQIKAWLKATVMSEAGI